ncbi:MAG: NUDIX hydrolase [Oscillospiraceae bacterium]|nr:NUDIX hydrolase [Oscillospiraceae bacterium]MBR6207534.1 NUDIX hydrolase [Oscillospiraceae bacterium]
MDDLSFREKEVRHLVENRWIDLREVRYTMPDGGISPPYYTYSRKNYCVIAATDEEGRCICVRQFRPGLGKVTCEFCAGGIERRGERQYGSPASAQEDPLEAAKRELLEETGYESEDWQLLLTVPSNATMADNYAYLFYARNCRRTRKQQLDDSEFLHVELLDETELRRRIRSGDFEQAMHILAWLLSKNTIGA